VVSFALLFRPRCVRRLKGCGHVDNTSALPTCPQPQQQTQKLINAGSRNKRSLAARMPGKHVKPPTDSAEEAINEIPCGGPMHKSRHSYQNQAVEGIGLFRCRFPMHIGGVFQPRVAPCSTKRISPAAVCQPPLNRWAWQSLAPVAVAGT
jgi:hypothetical protein